AWKRGERPGIEDYLARAASDDQAALLVELLRLDAEYRGKGDGLPPVPPGSATTPSPVQGTVPDGCPSVPGYEILGELGRGGMGVVYKAKHLKLNRVVALKVILSGAHAGADEMARFQTEAEAIARLQHPCIVGVFDVGEHDGRPFVALELCSGGSL